MSESRECHVSDFINSPAGGAINTHMMKRVSLHQFSSDSLRNILNTLLRTELYEFMNLPEPQENPNTDIHIHNT